MELFKELLAKLVQEEKIQVVFPQISDINKTIESACYVALSQIKEIINNDNISDKECFIKIEEIISVLQKNGIDFGNRHDF